MKRIFFGLVVLVCILNISCKSDKKETEPVIEETTETIIKNENEPRETQVKEEPDYYSETKKLAISLDAAADSYVTGNVMFSQEQGGVTMIAVLNGLTPGTHNAHIIIDGNCPANSNQYDGERKFHSEDIGVFTANDEGRATITKVTDGWCIGCDYEGRNIVGSGFFIFQGESDSNKVLACGKIQ